jgi:ankyrin repeat protein
MNARAIFPLITLLTTSIVVARAQSISPQRDFDHAVAELQKNPNDGALRENVIKLATTLNPPPTIPEEAKRHFARGAAIAREALQTSRPADDALAISEYRQAIALAPWLGNTYYNLSGIEEAAGQFDDATADLKLFLLSNPPEADANEARDHLYAIEAEKELAAKHDAERQATADAQKADADWKSLTVWLGQESVREKLAGPWGCGTVCKNVGLNVSSDSFEGSVTFEWTGFSNNEKAQDITVGVRGQLKAGVVVGGRAFFPALSDGICDFPADEQPLTGTITDDGGTLVLQTSQQIWVGYHQGMAIFAKCVSTTTQGTRQLGFQLNSNAPAFMPLDAAVSTGQLESVKLVLAHGANINAVNSGGRTALHIATLSDNWDIVKLLLESGAQANIADNVKTTPLHIAAQRNNYGIVQLLLDHGAQVSLTDSANETPLGLAVGSKSFEAAKVLVEHGASPNLFNKEGLSPLDLSLHNPEMAKLMLAHAGRIDAFTQPGSIHPLFLCDDTTTQTTELLFAQGADVNVQSSQGITPLAVAAAKNNFATTKIFLAHGARLDVHDNNGIYPLMNAAQSGNLEMVKLFIAQGARIDATDLKGHSLLWYANQGRGTEVTGWGNLKRSEGNKAVIEFFKSQGLRK